MRLVFCILFCSLAGCSSINYDAFLVGEKLHAVREYKNGFIEIISINKASRDGRVLTDASSLKFVKVSMINNYNVNINIYFENKDVATIKGYFNSGDFEKLTSNYKPFVHEYNVDLFFTTEDNFFFEQISNIKEDNLALYTIVDTKKNKSVIGNTMIEAVSSVYHELSHVEDIMNGNSEGVLSGEVKATSIQMCSSLKIKSFGKISIPKKLNKPDEREDLDDFVSQSILGKRQAIEKLRAIFNGEEVITKEMLLGVNQNLLNKFCYEI